MFYELRTFLPLGRSTILVEILTDLPFFNLTTIFYELLTFLPLVRSMILVEILINLSYFNLTTIFYELLTFLSLIVFLRYRIRLGDVSGSIDDSSGNAGLSYSNGMYFSTFDRDNDSYKTTNCAMGFKAGWWYKTCYRSLLNAPAPLTDQKNIWYTGHKWMNPTLTGMKIRPS